MNAAADNNELGRLRAERDRLLLEVNNLREQRDHALAIAAGLQTENAELRRRITELEGR